MLIKRLTNAIAKYKYSKEILDFAKPTPIKQQIAQYSLNYMLLHPICNTNKDLELELYMAEEAISISKQLNWTLQQGPFWQDEDIKDTKRSQKNNQDNQSQYEFQNQDNLKYLWKNSIAKSSLIQLSNIHSTTFFTNDNIAILGQHILSKRINVVFINHELTSLQIRNLELLWNQYITSTIKEEINNIDKNNQNQEDYQVKVFDRFTMILQIFAKRSTQGITKLQIELSFLKFLYTKLEINSNILLSLSSIFKEHLQIAQEIYFEVVSAQLKRDSEKISETRENELQLQKRLVDDKIVKVKQLIQEECLKIKRKKPIHTVPRIALIGFINAGKSSLLNCILHKDIIQNREQLSQIIDNSKSMKLASGQKALIIDPIGFITDLPDDLVESFKSNLKEVEDADIVLHIRDISHPQTEQQKQVVLNILKELGFNQDFFNNKMIEVWNKIDMLKQSIDYDFIESQDYPIIPISALMNINIKKLLQVMEEKSNHIMNKKLYRLRYNIDQHFERLRWLYDNGNISGVKNEMQIPPVKKGDPTIIEYDVIIDEIIYNRYIATFQPEIRINKNKGKSLQNWK